MNRQNLSPRLLLPLGLVLAVIAPPSVNAGEITFVGEELLCRPTGNSITVSVVPNGDISLYYQYGTSPGLYSAKTTTRSATAGQPVEIVVERLRPNTRYYYRMQCRTPGGDWVARDERSFHTQRASGSSFSFTVTSDSHVGILLGDLSVWRQTLLNIARDPVTPDFHLDLGDTFAMDHATTAAQAEQAYVFQRPHLGLIGHSTPIFLAIGNHEQEEGWHLDDTGDISTSQPVLGTNARKKYFPNPVPDASFYTGNEDVSTTAIEGDHLKEDYYAWEWGDALFVVLDPFWYTTTKPFKGDIGGGESSDVGSGDRWDWTLGRNQFEWLRSTLEGSAARFKFVFAHHMTGGSEAYVRGGAGPAHLFEWGGSNEDGRTTGFDAKRAEWGGRPVRQLMIASGVSAFFHGHDHQYAYERRDGVVYQSLPSAGFSGNGFGIYREGDPYTIKALSSPGHLRVSVSPSHAIIDYIRTSGGVAYSYQIPAAAVAH
ncbi:MAG: metallophosphoesterase [Vicinamibacteria bacterium]|nr:metallophosphoesterase [Vicinamibacteria bacterium]